jgi:hypothetical protein
MPHDITRLNHSITQQKEQNELLARYRLMHNLSPSLILSYIEKLQKSSSSISLDIFDEEKIYTNIEILKWVTLSEEGDCTKFFLLKLEFSHNETDNLYHAYSVDPTTGKIINSTSPSLLITSSFEEIQLTTELDTVEKKFLIPKIIVNGIHAAQIPSKIKLSLHNWCRLTTKIYRLTYLSWPHH